MSVIVVCWNSEDVLGRCLDHLLKQDYTNYEIIVVDDGSRDGTLEVAKCRLSRGVVTVVSSPLNRGCPHARNLGLRLANGEFIAFIDSDGFAASSWLSNIVDAFAEDDHIGGVASTVFFASNPLAINGAGGRVNRQGWATDAAGNESYERAEIVSEAIYPMGCGMAVRTAAVERVGPFDDRMLNYYDDVDYGVRLWRAGYRIVVAPDAWIDHGFGQSSGDSPRKALLCEQHRMRCMLKHAPLGTLVRWTIAELREIRRAWSPRHEIKLEAVRWNVHQLPNIAINRWRLRKAPQPPSRLIDTEWGDAAIARVPPVRAPRPETASNGVDMADPTSGGRLPYGWFSTEGSLDHSYRWAGQQACVLLRLDVPVRTLRLEYRLARGNLGTVALMLRRLDSDDPSFPVWTAELSGGNEWCSEKHPASLPPGDYEAIFSAERTTSGGSKDPRRVSLALMRMAFEASWVRPSLELSMSDDETQEQLVSGWHAVEEIDGRLGRWATKRGVALIRLDKPVSSLRLGFRSPPRPTGELTVSVRRPPSWRVLCSGRISDAKNGWSDRSVPLSLGPGDYALTIESDAVWTNPDGRDTKFAADDRRLGFAVSSWSFWSPDT